MGIIHTKNQTIMPMGWKEITLGNQEYFDLIMGQSPASETYSDKKIGLPFLQGNADFGSMYPSPKIFCNEPQKIAEIDDVLISVRAPVGEVNIAAERYCIGRGLGAIRPKDKGNSKYLYYYLTYYRHELERKSAGSTFKAIVKEDIEKFSILLPSTEEKQKIVTILTTIDDAIERSHQTVAETERLKAGVMHELMTKGIRHTEFHDDPDVGRVPEGWNVKQLNEVCQVIVDCPHSTPVFHEKGILVIRTTNVRDGELNLNPPSYVSEADYRERISRCEPSENDILFTREAPVGEACLVPPQTRLCLGQRMMLMRPDSQKIDPYFLVNVLYRDEIRKKMFAQSGGVTAKHLNVADVKILKIPVPPLSEQKMIAIIIRELAQKLTLQRQRTAHYDKLKLGLMNELLTGKRRVAGV